ncbi:MAG: AEC family transporter [Holosporales bacterium]|jgi:predicted permease
MIIILLQRIAPLYVYVLLGFFAGRFLKIDRQQMARLVIYLIAPLMFLGSVSIAPLDIRYLLLPVITFVLAIFMSGLMFLLVGRFYPDARRYLIASISGTGNTGYFGVPVFLTLAGSEALGVYMLAMLGMTFFEASIGYYLIARGNYSVRDSMKRLLMLPTLYAVGLGLLVKVSGVAIPTWMLTGLEQVRGAYVVLGMMLVGVGLSMVRRLQFDIAFNFILLLMRFVFWPILVMGVLALDYVFLGFFDSLARTALWVLAIVPLAANTVAFASEMNLHPEKTATAVAISTVLAIFTVPLVAQTLFLFF